MDGKISFIDLRNDSLSTPTQQMKIAMRDSIVGDDVYGEDPTINKLEQLIAEFFGKEAALFVPSRTMANQISILVNSQKGTEIILGLDSHIITKESGASGIISGVQTVTLPTTKGELNLQAVQKAIRKDNFDWISTTSLICVENPSQGFVLSLDYLKSLKEIGQKYKIPIHMDASRVINAAFALNCGVKEISQFCDSLTFVLTKGLCCPIGAVLVGKKEFIVAARKKRKVLGGGLRQVGILGGAGIKAIQNNVKEIQIDNQMAQKFLELLGGIQGVQVEGERSQTNVVYWKFKEGLGVDLKEFAEFLLSQGIQILIEQGQTQFRFFFYRNIRQNQVESVVGAIQDFLNSRKK